MAGLQPTEAALRQLNVSPVEVENDKPCPDDAARRLTDGSSSTASSFSKVLNPNAQSFSPSVASSPSSSTRSVLPPVVGSPPPTVSKGEVVTPPPPPSPPPPARHPATAVFQHAPPTMSVAHLDAGGPHQPPRAMPPIPWMYHQAPPPMMMEDSPSPPSGMPSGYMMPYPHHMEPPPSPSAPLPPIFLQTQAIGPPGQMMQVTPAPPAGQMLGLSAPSPYGWPSYGPGHPPPPPPPPAPSHLAYGIPYGPQPSGQASPHAPHRLPYGEYQTETRNNVVSFANNSMNGARKGIQRSLSQRQAEGLAMPCANAAPPASVRRSFDSAYHHAKSSRGSGNGLHCNKKHTDAIPERKSCDGRLYGRDNKHAGQGGKEGGGCLDPQFAFDLTEARRQAGSPPRTTLMIRNIPNKYSQKMLLAMLDKGYSGCYDFFYLPIDFKNRCNLGYAFINFREGTDSAGFYEEFHNKRWQDFNSKKVCEITYARVQGRQALVEHFRNSKFPCEELDYLPLVFEPLEADSQCTSQTPKSTDGQAAPLKMKAVPITLCDTPTGAVNMVTAH